ncbi:dockerin type I repeat-containing protein [Herbivorax sp. ANBcel31]|uniref:dockerin type I repeat-containing protein n=1 Tax=Herbivorax sp. ANBcel31 TaxID=3069754 RepID=UPI0027B70136|nr:dockerin type I repeat-containing protein [Herbivorax sp. ANBcel31]MDQ2086602.1 dockerin type I repeat-containing protein [Herbivorax sp. ANBcel31]
MYVKMVVSIFIFSAFSLLNITGVLAEGYLSVSDFEDYFSYEDGSYILMDNIVVDSNLEVNQNIVLNGYNLTVEKNLILNNQNIDLDSGTLTVNGDFYQSGYDSDNPSLLYINEGNLIVEGSFEIIDYSILSMNYIDDFVQVHDDFYFVSSVSHKDYLTDGTLELKGDFYYDSFYLFDTSTFLPSDSHKVILNGEDVQNINFNYPDESSFNILELTKPLETGYVFSHTPVWNELIEPNASFTLGDLDGNGTIDSTDLALLKRYILNVIDEIPAGSETADLNGDGEIDSTDYTLLQRFVLDMITEFPANQ